MVEETTYRAMVHAKENIAAFHRKQLPNSWFETGDDGSFLGMRYTPLSSVGAYVPGGSAPLVSSVLMTVVPAKVAGVERIVMATPPGPDGKINPYLLVAAKLSGATQILRAGGAHGIGALAYGIEGLEPVDKIVGPGNLFVTLAKKQVLGRVGIDMLAGPSEVLVLADETAKPHWVAADLLSQAEHGADSAAILITTSQKLAEKVVVELEEQCKKLNRSSIASESLTHSGRIVVCRDLDEAAALANIVAPEHLELSVAEPARLLGKIRHAGAIFLGHHSPEPVGDYFAGPNHVLPTNGTARFSSPLGVEDYLRRSSIISYSAKALARDSSLIEELATVEGLFAHRNAVAIRRERKDD
jgi:histidinol dehydrogenase